MTNLKTKESTLQALERASRTPPTSEEMKKQRVSFIMGSLNKDNPDLRPLHGLVTRLLDEQLASVPAPVAPVIPDAVASTP